MDKLSELSHGAKVVLGSAIALLIVSFFNWFEVKNTSYGESMWHGIGFLAGLLVIVLIVWQAIRLANINIEIGVTQLDDHGGSLDPAPDLHVHPVHRQAGRRPRRLVRRPNASGRGSGWPSQSSSAWERG